MYVILTILFLTALSGVLIYKTIKSKEEYIRSEYEEELIEYFKEIALKTEYHQSPHRTIKWKKPMRLYVSKEKEYEVQMNAIEETIDNINALIKDGFKIELTDNQSKSNAILYLFEKDKFAQLEPNIYKSIEDDYAGLASVEFDWGNYSILTAKIFISTEEPVEIQVSTILEEITHSIGLLTDSERYPNSIFYEHQMRDSIFNNEYSQMDADIIRLLYNPKMKSGLNSKQCERVIKRILKNLDWRMPKK